MKNESTDAERTDPAIHMDALCKMNQFSFSQSPTTLHEPFVGMKTVGNGIYSVISFLVVFL
jgi:hypothetical protein